MFSWILWCWLSVMSWPGTMASGWSFLCPFVCACSSPHPTPLPPIPLPPSPLMVLAVSYVTRLKFRVPLYVPHSPPTCTCSPGFYGIGCQLCHSQEQWHQGEVSCIPLYVPTPPPPPPQYLSLPTLLLPLMVLIVSYGLEQWHQEVSCTFVCAPFLPFLPST